MEANPSCDSALHLYFIRPSADPEQLLFFEGSFFFFFFCCCSYFPLTLIIQMYWGPCALPHHKGNHRTSDHRSTRCPWLAEPHARAMAQAARQDGDITCSHPHRPQKEQHHCKITALFGDSLCKCLDFFFLFPFSSCNNHHDSFRPELPGHI